MIVSNKREYVFMPKISMKPNQITLFNEVLYKDFETQQLKSLCGSTGYRTVQKSFHNFNLSINGNRSIKQKINWLYSLSAPRTIKTYSGKVIYKFKMNFLTLTLPSTQQHPTAEITKICFNQFITEMRQRCNLTNYVWRLEFQKNKNVHYHIATDCYIDYFFAQKVWNRIINKLNYVDVYQAKFQKLTLHQYWNEQSKGKFDNFAVYKKRFENGVNCNWTNPHTIDTKNCTSSDSISSYISKYFSKNDIAAVRCNDLDNVENSKSLRLWFCSRSLSVLKSICSYVENTEINFFELLKNEAAARIVEIKYATCLFFDFNKLSKYYKDLVINCLSSYSQNLGYNSA
jgi:hypothetical protein